VNWSDELVAEVPVDVVTVTSTTPAAWAGDVAVQLVVDAQVTAVAAVPPKEAVVEPTMKSVPVMVTLVPPASGPAVGLIAVIVGARPNVNRSAADVGEVPAAVVTVTSTVPMACAGDVAVQLVADAQLTDVAAVPPKEAVVEPTTKPEPVMVTVVPPACGPLAGLTAVIASGMFTVWEVDADGPPLFDMVWPVKTLVVEVSAVSVTVSDAVNGPAVA
jgi:hypothetical protein